MNSFINLMAFWTCNHPHKPRGFGSPQLSVCEEQCELNVNQIHHKNFIYGFQPETVTVIFSKEMKAEVSKLTQPTPQHYLTMLQIMNGEI